MAATRYNTSSLYDCLKGVKRILYRKMWYGLSAGGSPIKGVLGDGGVAMLL
ncbi:MAG: hypothetical protein GXP26_17885 [Planctomycetes bacterium]|nr:hypothetical protein [Planctomycetota bacterium]